MLKHKNVGAFSSKYMGEAGSGELLVPNPMLKVFLYKSTYEFFRISETFSLKSF